MNVNMYESPISLSKSSNRIKVQPKFWSGTTSPFVRYNGIEGRFTVLKRAGRRGGGEKSGEKKAFAGGTISQVHHFVIFASLLGGTPTRFTPYRRGDVTGDVDG
jgi:hypothetical protein